ncbi:FGGY family carbohydrate kinase [Devosia sp.]|uniref:FGGY-family carbohydrate kinase n=1 Tax=Devosia sp. TaxID=1871048 RepID=UPI0032636741
MTPPRSIAVIDIGKTNAKVVLIDGMTGNQVAARTTPNTVLRDGLYPHADTERLWAFILESLGSLHKAHGIEGISITTHGATAALMADDRLAMPVLDYEHNGPDEAAEAYGKVRPEFAESLSPRLPVGLNLGAQIFWQQQQFSEQFASVTDILTYPQYWAWRLTGVKASEVTSLGCHTDLWAPDAKTYSKMVVRQGWIRLFPEIWPAASVLGAILPGLAAITGLRGDTPVTCGIHDSNASLLPHLGAHEGAFTIISTGTWAICMTVGGQTTALDSARDSLANVDAFGRPVPTARFMGGREFDLLAPNAVTPKDADIAKVIGKDIQVLPTFVEGVGPFPDGKRRWTMEPEQLSPGERTAAVSLYLALVTQECLNLAGTGAQIIIEGPLARNALYGQALATLTGVPVAASGDATGTTLGASMLFEGVRGVGKEPVPMLPLAVDGFAAYCARWNQRARAS